MKAVKNRNEGEEVSEGFSITETDKAVYVYRRIQNSILSIRIPRTNNKPSVTWKVVND